MDKDLEQLRGILDISKDKNWRKFEIEALNEIDKSDVFLDYLKETMELDVKKYFSAQEDTDRAMIKGHFTFASYLRKQILTSRKVKETK